MSLFVCHQCDNLCDADDGCDEDPNDPRELICIDCMADGDPIQSSQSLSGAQGETRAYAAPQDAPNLPERRKL